jgi:hypothetical protein
MAVYRNEETSPPYRFYARNGHQDLLYARPWVWHQPCSLSIDTPAVEVQTWGEFLARERECLDVFASAYGSFGGYPHRFEGYYAPAVNTSQYNEIRVDLTVLVLRDGDGGLRGYAIAGEERGSPNLHLLEIAATGNDPSAGLSLLGAYTKLAADRGSKAIASMADSSPYRVALQALGYQPAPRSRSSMVIMAYALDPEGLARAVWREDESTAALQVVAWTPKREVVLHRSRRTPSSQVVLEMKEGTLTRLLFGRLDLESAVADERVTAVNGSPSGIRAIAQALPYTPWAYHYLDFV